MTADGSVRAIVDALALPTGARVDARVPKKLLIEQGAPTSTDKRAIQEGVDELQWFAACKPATIGVPAFAAEERDYTEIAVIGRSEERRVGTEWVSKCRSRWWPGSQYNKKTRQ